MKISNLLPFLSSSIVIVLLLLGAAFPARAQDDGRLIRIPVIFHVVHDKNASRENTVSEDNGNSSMYLPKEKIEAELADLNADFQNSKLNFEKIIPEYKNVVGNPNIQFYLFGDIKYIPVDKRQLIEPRNNIYLLHEMSSLENPKKFLNVYISLIKVDGRLSDGSTPDIRPQNYQYEVPNSVHINYQWVGLDYSLLTHEVGHWLGLYHTWDKRQVEFGINDIPLQKDMSEEGKCPPRDADKISKISKKQGFTISNYNNFMDYSGCRVMFSKKQADYMRKFIRLYRTENWNG